MTGPTIVLVCLNISGEHGFNTYIKKMYCMWSKYNHPNAPYLSSHYWG